MAEVKKKFSQLDPASVPFEGTEILAAVQGGITKRGTISGIHGAGWWDKLKAAFVDFVAPEALHANDADTIGGEASAELHNAGALTGTAPLSVIPAQLTGKNAATATYATNAGNAATATYATNAGNADTVDGIDFANGAAGTYGTQVIAANSTWLIPKGTYMFSLNGSFTLGIRDNEGVWHHGGGGCSGLMISDGINYRLENPNQATVGLGYRKLA
jgi:hypothetical protein